MTSPGVLLSVAILAIGTIQFGWNLAELNAPEEAIRKALHLTDAQVGLCGSIFAVGGLFGALLAGPLLGAIGRKKTLVISAIFYLSGGLTKGTAQSVAMLAFGRILSGLAAGGAAVIVPIFINDLAPVSAKGKFGAVTQVSMNVGILGTQIMGIFCNTQDLWRVVLLVGAALGAAQAFLLVGVPESPQYLYQNGDREAARKALVKLRGTVDIEEELASYEADATTSETEAEVEEEPLLSRKTPGPVGMIPFMTKKEYRASFLLVVIVMIAQQFTGINAVVMYGVAILRDMLPAYAGSLNAGISGVNLLITLAASTLFDRVSHRSLLLGSIGGMTVFSATLGLGIKFGIPSMSAIGILFFVASFAIGLGPLPWMVAVKNVSSQSIGSAQSLALVANWLGTATISFGVPVIAAALGMDVLFFGFTALGVTFFLWGLIFLP